MENIVSLRSLRTRIALVVIGVSLITASAILFYQQDALVESTIKAQEENSHNLVNTVALFIESHHGAIEHNKRLTLDKRKEMLQTMIDVAMAQTESIYNEYKKGIITEEYAKQQAISNLKKIRYDNDVGYFWINTTDLPYPSMIMHTTIPELDGQVLDSPEFDCALGVNENLFKAMATVCLANGEGFVDYLWPKPTEQGLTDRVPKLSFVKIFKPWNWVIGTGLYIDDIEQDAKRHLDKKIEDLQITFARVKVAKAGYMFMFTGNQDMFIHPTMAGKNMKDMLNPETGNPILQDLINAAHSPGQKFLYTWDKPPEFEGEYKFRKMAFVHYYPPLDWYIASSVYYDDVQDTARVVRLKVMFLGSIFLLMGLILSIWFSRTLTRPLQSLQEAAKSIHDNIDLKERVPISGSIETRELGVVLNSMLDSLQDEITERRQAEKTIKAALQEKEVLLREIHHRVKNNMAVVISMLNMQSKRVEDGETRIALEESRSRISAMSLIHETLYRSDNLAEIPFDIYIKNVFKTLRQAMMQSSSRLELELSGDPVKLTIEQAVPCGLVMNELITNSLKYGYPQGGAGKINIDTSLTDYNWIKLVYSDNGIGLPEDFDPELKKTLGMRIIRLLVENQMSGKLEWESRQGAYFKISWPLKYPEEEN